MLQTALGDSLDDGRPAPWASPEPLSSMADFEEFRAGLTAFKTGKWQADRWTTFRLRFGIYAQRQEGLHMVRAKVPGGRLPFQWARAAAAANRRFCGDDVHITTRQGLQFYGVTLDGTADLLEALYGAGMTSRESSGNTFRNVTACPLAGICPLEHVDAGAVAQRLSTTWLRHPLVQHMPRKLKASVSGCALDCGATSIDDLGFIATVRDGKPGFRVVAGGGLGSKPRVAIKLKDFVTEDEMAAVQEALARVHHRFSNRKKKMASRIKFLIDRFGEKRFIELFEEEFARARSLPRRPWEPLEWRSPFAGERPELPGGRIEQHDGFVAVVVRPPLGMLSSERLEKLTDIAEAAGAREFRLTREQNIVVASIPSEKAGGLIEKVRDLGLEVNDGKWGAVDVVSCPGSTTCPIAITNSSAFAEEILADPGTLAGLGETRVRISGCHNSCGQHHVGDIAFHGLAKKVGRRHVPHYQVHLGGEPDNPGAIALEGPIVPARHAKQAFDLLLSGYAGARGDGESVRRWAERTGEDGIEKLLAPVTAGGYDELDPSLNIDLGDDGPFFPPATAVGECAAAAVVAEYLADLARVGRLDMDRALAAGDRDGAFEAGRRGLIAAARRLLAVIGSDTEDGDDEKVISGIKEHYAANGALPAVFDAVLDAEKEAAQGVNGLGTFKNALDAWIEAIDTAVEETLSPMSMIGLAPSDMSLTHPGKEQATRLSEKLGHLDGAELLRAMVLEEFPGRIAVTSSFGVEAAVLLDLVARIDPATPVIFLDTGQLFAMTHSYREILQARLGLTNVRVVHPDPSAIAKADTDHGLWQRDHDACCQLRKVLPLEKALVGFDAWITGRKRFQGGERENLSTIEFADGRVKINPLARWSPERIEAAFEERDLPRHPLAGADGFTSVGCRPCTQRTAPGGDARLGRWAGNEKTECGIHKAKWHWAGENI